MVELKAKRYGIDLVGDSIRIAGRSGGTGRIHIDCFNLPEKDNLGETGIAFDDSDIYFTIPEKDAIIKKVRVPRDAGIESQKLAEFEFMASSLDNAEDFILETHPLNKENERLVFGYRRHLVEQRIKFIEQNASKPSGFKLRAWALADGYLNYCRPEGGELVCLLDISGKHCSICFLEKNRPVIADAITDNGADKNDAPDKEYGLLTDLAAVIQYHQVILFNAGCTAPLSLLIISGEKVTRDLLGAVEQKIGVKAVPPQVHESLFTSEAVGDILGYLVCLGLTVDI
jgi:hypothetical protein